MNKTKMHFDECDFPWNGSTTNICKVYFGWIIRDESAMIWCLSLLDTYPYRSEDALYCIDCTVGESQRKESVRVKF